MSYPKAYELACAQAFGESVCTPNDILGVEYAKAAKRFGAKFQLLPIKRQGNGYLDESLQGEFLSATAIRKSVENGVIAELSPYLPQCVLNDLQRSENRLSVMERAAILTKTQSDLKAILDCTEGLENAFLKAAATSDDFVETLTCSRYTSARIRRIALHCLLGIREDFIRECLTMPLYLTPLAYKKEATDLLKALDEATIPFLSSGKRIKALTGTGRRCFERDEFAETMYAAVKNIATAKNSPFLL
jgi:predicted nucleotidyltransferase